MSFERIKSRLQTGRPLVVASDICASFRARGVSLDSPGAIGQLLRDAVTLRLDGDTITQVGFEGQGCAISRAATSMMTVSVKGRARAEVEALAEIFHALVHGHALAPGQEERLGKLRVFAGVSAFPARVKCASLPWHTLRAALAGGGGAISTE